MDHPHTTVIHLSRNFPFHCTSATSFYGHKLDFVKYLKLLHLENNKPIYDIVIYNVKCVFGLQPVSGTEFLIPLVFPVRRAFLVFFYYVNEVTSRKHLSLGPDD